MLSKFSELGISLHRSAVQRNCLYLAQSAWDVLHRRAA